MSAAKSGHVVVATGLVREARIASDPYAHAVSGGGDARYLAGALDLEARNNACGVISFGIAGGLLPGLASGAWLVGKTVMTLTMRWRCDEAWTRTLHERLPGASLVDIVGADVPVMEPEAKRTLHEETRAAAIDMESHIAAQIAAAHHLPFAAFRVIADTANQSIPAVATVALAPGGGIDARAVVRSLAQRPTQTLLLVRSAIDAHRALRALLRGRRLLGPGLGFPNPSELMLDVS